MERRAEDFIFNQENALIRGAIRAWVAQERGVLLERVRRSRLFAAYLDKWREKMSGIHDLELRRQVFTNKTRLTLQQHAFAAWYQDFSSLQTYNLVAEQQYALSVNSRCLVAWKAALADNVRKMKSAKIARRWFLLRRGWKVWKKTLEERKLVKKMEQDERTLELYEKEWLRKRLLGKLRVGWIPTWRVLIRSPLCSLACTCPERTAESFPCDGIQREDRAGTRSLKRPAFRGTALIWLTL